LSFFNSFFDAKHQIWTTSTDIGRKYVGTITFLLSASLLGGVRHGHEEQVVL
jgi:hypothetical protein